MLCLVAAVGIVVVTLIEPRFWFTLFVHDDAKLLEGEWKIEEALHEGHEIPLDFLGMGTVVIQEDKMKFQLHEAESMNVDVTADALTFKLNQDAFPKQIDLTQPLQEGPMFGIYELKGDTFILIGGQDKTVPRPTDLISARTAKKTTYFKFKRLK